jgi:hypothetical protein
MVLVVVMVVAVNVVYPYRSSQKPFSRWRDGHTRVISGCYVPACDALYASCGVDFLHLRPLCSTRVIDKGEK